MRPRPLLGLQTQERHPCWTEACCPRQGSGLGHRRGETDQKWKQLEHEKELGQKMRQHELPFPRCPCLPALLPPRRMCPKRRLDHGTSCLWSLPFTLATLLNPRDLACGANFRWHTYLMATPCAVLSLSPLILPDQVQISSSL